MKDKKQSRTLEELMAQPPADKTNEELFNAVLPCVTPADTDPAEDIEFQLYSQGCLIELWQRLKKAESPLRLIVSVNGEMDTGEEVSVVADRELPITFRAFDCDDDEDGAFGLHEMPSGEKTRCWMSPVTESYPADPDYVERVWNDRDWLPEDESTEDRPKWRRDIEEGQA